MYMLYMYHEYDNDISKAMDVSVGRSTIYFK
jgi:hypothetical protein